MKTLAAFALANAAIVGIQCFAAAAVLGLGQLVLAADLGESWLAWAIAGILAAGGAISVAARLASYGRGHK